MFSPDMMHRRTNRVRDRMLGDIAIQIRDRKKDYTGCQANTGCYNPVSRLLDRCQDYTNTIESLGEQDTTTDP